MIYKKGAGSSKRQKVEYRLFLSPKGFLLLLLLLLLDQDVGYTFVKTKD
jgi:hypothetical protein